MRTLTAVPPWHAQYEALYREHSARVVRLCRLLLDDPQEAQEVAQEVFVKLLRRHHEPGGSTQWGAWLTRVAVNACRDRRRSAWWKQWRQRHQVIEDMELVASEPTPERAAIGRESRTRIWRAFRELPRRQREVFVLRHLEEWSTQDVADALGLTTGSVKRHLFRAVERLRKILGGS